MYDISANGPIDIDCYAYIHVHVKYDVRFFFGSLLSGGRVFLLALSAAGQASLPWVHYEACLDLGLAPWRRSAH